MKLDETHLRQFRNISDMRRIAIEEYKSAESRFHKAQTKLTSVNIERAAFRDDLHTKEGLNDSDFVKAYAWLVQHKRFKDAYYLADVLSESGGYWLHRAATLKELIAVGVF